jgi:nucleoid DNA-binding protein
MCAIFEAYEPERLHRPNCREDAAQQNRGRTYDQCRAVIAEALSNGGKVDLRGFGSFQVSGKKERQGRNPRTGKSMTIPAKSVAVLKPSKELSDRVNATSAPDQASEAASEEDAPVAQLSEGSAKVHRDKIKT